MLSHVGRARKTNEDTCAASPAAGAFVVCDGMGGAAAGEVASRLAADTFLGQMTPHDEVAARTVGAPDARLTHAIEAANQAVYRNAQTAKFKGMGTTLVALLIERRVEEDSAETALTLRVAHVGDSRCYLFRDSELKLLTEDHSLVEEQVRNGEITPAQALVSPLRHIITRAIGSQAMVQPEIQTIQPLPGDIFLLASDGLTRELTDSNIQAAVRRAKPQNAKTKVDLQQLCRTLIDEANDHGGGDNITVLLLMIA
jgi:protein phosphatase